MMMSQLLEMESAARTALANSPIYALHNIHVSSDGEQLLLSGRLPSFYYKQLAQEAVRVVIDEVSFVNDIEVAAADID